MLEQKFKPNKEKLGLTDISIDISQKDPEYMEKNSENLSRFPHVYYNEYELENTSIDSLSIDFNTFIPTLTMNYVDLRGIIHKHGLPVDDSRLKIMFPSNNKALGNIVMEFKIEVYDAQTEGTKNIKKYNIVGILSLNKLLTSEYKVYSDKTSYEVFEQFARESGLGFVSNVSSTNDRMNWTNFGIRNLEFLEDVRDHAWIGETNFVWAYIDPFYNLVLVDVEKSMTQELTDIIWAMDEVFSQDNQTGDSVISGPPVLTTNDQYMTTNIHVYDYFIKNNSTQISLERGYRRNIHYYDIDGNWKDRAGHYHKYSLDTITTPGTETTKVYAKSDDAEFYSMNSSQIYAGVMDTKNVHPDYLWAKIQNSENVREMEKFIVQAILQKQNFNIKRFEKIQLHDIENKATIDDDRINSQMSNDYLCIGFSLDFGGDSLAMYVNLISRELQPPNPSIQ